MSSGVDFDYGSSSTTRPGLWSYFSSFSNSAAGGSSSTTRNRRTSSVSLPSNNNSGNGGSRSSRYTAPTTSSLYSPPSRPSANGMIRGQRSRYIKAAGIIAVLVFVFFFLVPSERESVSKYVGEHAPFGSGSQRGSNSESSSSSGSSGSSKDLQNEDGPTEEGECTKPYTAGKPLKQYVLMIDAGSTGSRIHVYRFNNCGPTPELEDEIFEQTAKREGGAGLSAYPDDPEAAARSLDPLLEVAMKNVPEDVKACTPIAVKATAGLRKLGPERSDRILKAVRARLETAYPFAVVSEEKGGVEVMDGKYEGVYAWITTNYLLGKIGGPDELPTGAVFDLGGGSTQIVFEPNFKTAGTGMPKKLSEGDHKYELDFGGRQFSLYQHSYLGYGLMAARKNVHLAVVEAVHAANPHDQAWLQTPIVNPCIAPGMSREVEVELPTGHALGAAVTVKMVGPKSGSPVTCQAIAEQTLRKDAECKLHPCAFDGVHQPALAQTFAKEDVYLFSYFYDRIRPLGVPESFTLRELKDLAARVCEGESEWDVFGSVKGATEELKGRAETCLDLNFMFALLHLGYEMPIDREVKIAKKIKGNELGWCLGARYVFSTFRRHFWLDDDDANMVPVYRSWRRLRDGNVRSRRYISGFAIGGDWRTSCNAVLTLGVIVFRAARLERNISCTVYPHFRPCRLNRYAYSGVLGMIQASPTVGSASQTQHDYH
jgi:guanosine-diphosphatase